MAGIPIPNGAKVALATAFAAPDTITAISNASVASVSAVAHGIAANTPVLLSVPGWINLDNQVRRIGTPTTDAFPLPGLDTTSVADFPAGAGSGNAKAITAWTPLPYIPKFEKTGGEPKTQTSNYLDVEKEREFFTGTTAERLNFTISYRPADPAFAALVAAGKSGTVQVISLTLKDGTVLYYSGELYFNSTPVTTKDSEMVCNGSLALQADITRF